MNKEKSMTRKVAEDVEEFLREKLGWSTSDECCSIVKMCPKKSCNGGGGEDDQFCSRCGAELIRDDEEMQGYGAFADIENALKYALKKNKVPLKKFNSIK